MGGRLDRILREPSHSRCPAVLQHAMALGRFENALEGSQDTLDDEDSIACKVLAGLCLFESKRIREGHTLLQTAIANHPNSAALLCGYGRMLEKIGDYEDAMEKLHEAYEISPEDPQVNFSLGMVMKEKGKTEEAIERFQSVVEHEPNNGEAHYLLAQLLDLSEEDATVVRAITCLCCLVLHVSASLIVMG